MAIELRHDTLFEQIVPDIVCRNDLGEDRSRNLEALAEIFDGDRPVTINTVSGVGVGEAQSR
jgi:hypothetical protein